MREKFTRDERERRMRGETFRTRQENVKMLNMA